MRGPYKQPPTRGPDGLRNRSKPQASRVCCLLRKPNTGRLGLVPTLPPVTATHGGGAIAIGTVTPMGLDITVMIADWSWLGEVPPRERLPRLRNAWYADETGLWDFDAPAVEGDWEWPRGPNNAYFAVYEFRRTCGSFKPHFWAEK